MRVLEIAGILRKQIEFPARPGHTCVARGEMNMKNSALEGFQERFQSILDDFDGFEMDEELEELNAQLEDALFLLECSEDDAEELQGAIEEMKSAQANLRNISAPPITYI